jgi:beta-aspartyl-dipeptidase (metallo-type)
VVERLVAKWTKYYLSEGGPPENFTISSDADSSTPDVFYGQFCELVVKHRMELELVLPFVTSNTARILKLKDKGKVEEGCDADVLVLSRDSLDIRDVIAKGKRLVADGTCKTKPKFLEESSRRVELIGDENEEPVHLAGKAN